MDVDQGPLLACTSSTTQYRRRASALERPGSITCQRRFAGRNVPPAITRNSSHNGALRRCNHGCMADGEPRQSEAARDCIFAMHPEPELRELMRCLIASPHEMADLERRRPNRPGLGTHQRPHTESAQRMRRRAAAMDHVAASMSRCCDEVGARGLRHLRPGNGRNRRSHRGRDLEQQYFVKYFVWERELSRHFA